MTVDYAHGRGADDNRHRKALALRAACILEAIDPITLRALIDPDHHAEGRPHRLRIRKLAGLDREPSHETWTAALVELERRPARIVAEEVRDRQAPCGCWPARDNGVLYEFPPSPRGPLGWSCPHPSDYVREDSIGRPWSDPRSDPVQDMRDAVLAEEVPRWPLELPDSPLEHEVHAAVRDTEREPLNLPEPDDDRHLADEWWR